MSRRFWLLGFSCVLLAGCSGECENLAGKEQDRCYYQRVLATPADGASTVKETAALIADPIVRAAAVRTWVLEHTGAIPRAEALALCDTLPAGESPACRKRLEAAHLNR